jgi:hypothetical protein
MSSDPNRTRQDLQKRLDTKNARKSYLEPLYLRAREYVKTPQYQQQRDDALAQITRALNQFKGSDATNAVFVLGQIKQILAPLEAITAPIVEYESIQKSLVELGKVEEGLKG